MRTYKLLALTSMFLLLSCYSYNRPISISANSVNTISTTKVFVDMNGDYYPNNWQRDLRKNRIKSSLFLAYKNENKLHKLKTFRSNFLIDFKKKIKNKSRIYILIHGFNNSETKAKEAYYNLTQRISIDKKNDEIIEFYWDGLTGKGLGSGKIWFNSAGYSQMCGIFGLRPILNQIYDKEVFVISHSRGASVLLSALSNPPWNKKFERDTKKILLEKFTNRENLKSNNNTIKSIMLAPAIGNIDFFNPHYNSSSISTLENYRALNPQLTKIWITKNSNDIILKKGVNFLSAKFNPTNLGYLGNGLNILNQVYGEDFIIQHDFSKERHSHSFLKYIENKELPNLFETAGIPNRK